MLLGVESISNAQDRTKRQVESHLLLITYRRLLILLPGTQRMWCFILLLQHLLISLTFTVKIYPVMLVSCDTAASIDRNFFLPPLGGSWCFWIFLLFLGHGHCNQYVLKCKNPCINQWLDAMDMIYCFRKNLSCISIVNLAKLVKYLKWGI